MCLSCDCGEPANSHGDDRHITMDKLQDAADAAGISPEQAAANIVHTLAHPAAEKALDTDAMGMDLLKSEPERRYTLGLGYPAMKPDVGKAADGFRDYVSEAVLEATAWEWMRKHRNVGLYHRDGTDFSGEVVESYLYRGPDWSVTTPGGKTTVIKAGDWLVGVVWSEQAWPLVKAGLINGYSPQGGAKRAIPSPERLAQLRS